MCELFSLSFNNCIIARCHNGTPNFPQARSHCTERTNASNSDVEFSCNAFSIQFKLNEMANKPKPLKQQQNHCCADKRHKINKIEANRENGLSQCSLNVFFDVGIWKKKSHPSVTHISAAAAAFRLGMYERHTLLATCCDQ